MHRGRAVKKIFQIYLLIESLLIFQTCSASSKEDAIKIFTSSVLRSFKDRGNFPDPSEFAAPYPPKGGYLTQFEFDVTQDGVPELFLRSTLHNVDRSLGKLTIFDISVSPPRKLAGDLALGSSFGVVREGQALTLVAYEGTTRFGQGFIRRSFQFKKSGALKEQEVIIDMKQYDQFQADKNLTQGNNNLEELLMGTKEIVHIKSSSKILLMDYINDPSASWSLMKYVEGYGLLSDRAVYTSDSNGGGYTDPTLGEDTTRAQSFYLQDASAKLGISLQEERRSDKRGSPEYENLKLKANSISRNESIRSNKNFRGSSNKWGLLVAIFILVCGFVVLFLKKKS